MAGDHCRLESEVENIKRIRKLVLHLRNEGIHAGWRDDGPPRVRGGRRAVFSVVVYALRGCYFLLAITRYSPLVMWNAPMRGSVIEGFSGVIIKQGIRDQYEVDEH